MTVRHRRTEEVLESSRSRCPKRLPLAFARAVSTAAPTPARCIRCRRRLQALLVLLMGSDPRGTPCLPGRSARTKHRYTRGRIGDFFAHEAFPHGCNRNASDPRYVAENALKCDLISTVTIPGACSVA